MTKGLLQYDVRTLLALQQAIAGSRQFFEYLIQSRPELAAFSNFLQEDAAAEGWLVQNGFGWLGLMSHAIDGDSAARSWVLENLHRANFMFCMACRNDDKAISWLRFMRLDIFLRLAGEVADLRHRQELDAAFPYKMKFS